MLPEKESDKLKRKLWENLGIHQGQRILKDFLTSNFRLRKILLQKLQTQSQELQAVSQIVFQEQLLLTLEAY